MAARRRSAGCDGCARGGGGEWAVSPEDSVYGRRKPATLSLDDALADRFPDDLSGGEQQRVAIARAFVGSRQLLLADEPTGALDSVTGEAVMRLMRGHCDRGHTAVLVTHDAAHAGWADRVVFLRDGAIVDQAGGAGAGAPPPRGGGRRSLGPVTGGQNA